jgi:hypothetical protein
VALQMLVTLHQNFFKNGDGINQVLKVRKDLK